MVSLQELMTTLNDLLLQDEFVERAEIKHVEYEYRGQQVSQDFLVIENPHDPERGIAISYDDTWQEWTVEYLGAHEHFSRDTMESLIDKLYGDIVLAIVMNFRVVAYGKKGTPYEGTILTRDVYVEGIPEIYTDEEKETARNFGARRWSGEVTNEATICYALFEYGAFGRMLKERKDV